MRRRGPATRAAASPSWPARCGRSRNSSAEAAKEIRSLIATSTGHVGRGVKLVGNAGLSLDRIVSQVGEVHNAIAEIAASAKEQSTGLREVNSAVNQMDQMTQQNAAMVEQSTAASHNLAQETANLVRLTGRFQTGAVQPAHEPANARPSPRPAEPAPHPKRTTALRVVSHRRDTPAPSAAHADGGGWKEF